MPGLRVCTTSRKANKSKKSRAKRHHPPPSDNLTYDTSIAHLMIVPRISQSGKAKIKLVEDYNHLLGRHCAQLPSTVPWLSQLPDNVISRILSFLPLKEAGQTSILSKRWRFLWSFMPMLKFPTVASVVFVTNVLKLFKAPHVEVLRLSIDKIVGRIPTVYEVNSWLSLACSRIVEHLVVEFTFHYLYSCPMANVLSRVIRCVCPGFSTIKRLVLSSCRFESPSYEHLTSLEHLVLEDMILGDHIVARISSSCPMLQELELRNCNWHHPFHVSMTNPKTCKLTFYDCSGSKSLLELHAPYLTMLIISSEFRRRTMWNVPSLSTFKILCQSLRAAGSRKKQSFRAAEAELGLLAPPIDVKCLHFHTHNFPRELPGLIHFLQACSGIETLVLDLEMCLERMNLARHVMYLSTAVLKDTELEINYKKKIVCLDERHSWGFLRFLLSSQMPDLSCVVINGFKRMYKIGKACNDGTSAQVCYAVDKFEFKLLRLLLNYSLSLKTMTIRTKDVYLIEGNEIGMDKAVTVKCKKLYLNHEVDEMEIPEWNKMLFSLPRCSPRAKINIING